MKSFAITSLLASSVAAWGVAGHEITATIAQILLTDRTREQICQILPPWTNCHLAPVAAWADRIKGDPWWRSWTSSLHYIDPLGDWPSQHCDFGGQGWQIPDRNILLAINNYTRIVEAGEGQERDYALRFLIHYLGDLHQPLHLTGRERGGNDIKVRFEHRVTSLHSVWDGGLVTKAIREIANYTTPVPEKRIERALRGTIYDPYVRFIAKEGLLGWWKDEYSSWAQCPTPSLIQEGEGPASAELAPQSHLRRPETNGFPSLPDDPSLPVCPHFWASGHQDLNCKIIFPPQLDTPNPHKTSWLLRMAKFITDPRPVYMELDTPEYAGRVREGKVLEKLLAMGGVRLAAVLNDLFDPPTAPEGKRAALDW